MIAIDSTGYPTLAVIQHFNIPEEHHGKIYELSHAIAKNLRQDALGIEGPPIDPGLIMVYLQFLSWDAYDQLVKNQAQAIKEQGWGTA